MFGFSNKKSKNKDILASSKSLDSLVNDDFLEGLEIHVMPSKFVNAEKNSKSKKKFLIAAAVVSFMLIVAAMVSFYLFQTDFFQKYNEPENISNSNSEKNNDLENDEDVENQGTALEVDQIGPKISSIKEEVISGGKALVTWKTDEEATSLVEYGISESADKLIVSGSDELLKNHSVILGNLKAGVYEYRVISADIKKNTSTSTAKTFEIENLFPIITSINAKEADNKILIVWETDRPSNSRVKYGITKDPYPLTSPVNPSLVRKHAISLANLKPNTEYYYKVISSVDGFTSTSTENTFKTGNIAELADADKDGLTDLEEELFLSDKFAADSDEDGYLDGLEVVNLYNPASYTSERLDKSGLIKIYKADNYNVFYPKNWTAASNEKNKVVFTAENGEFIQVLVFPNNNSISSIEWYKLQSSGDGNDAIEEIINKFEIEGVKPNENAIYLNDYNNIYLLNYNLGASGRINYPTIFEMMWQNFEITSAEAVEVEAGAGSDKTIEDGENAAKDEAEEEIITEELEEEISTESKEDEEADEIEEIEEEYEQEIDGPMDEF